MKRPFVNRTEELKQLRQALKYDGQEMPVLVFTGVGGMGKTALRSAFEEKILKPKGIPYAALDYDGDPNLRPIEATLRAFRRQLGRFKIKTPVFDYLYARYFELSTGVKLSNKNFPIELEGVINILEGIPFVSNVTQIIHGLTQLGLAAQDRLKHKEWLYRIRELEPHEILNLLPEVLADDLEEVMSIKPPKMLKSSEARTTLIMDAYERISESQLDDTLHRKLLLLTPHMLRVIFTRDSLPWEHKYPNEWKEKIEHIPPLDDLIPEDAKLFLKKKKIKSPELQHYLYELTGGFPLHLELCADIYAEIKKSTGREPVIQDFEGTREAEDLTEGLVNRLLRQLKDDERDLMRLAAYPRWVTEEILEEISSVPESVERIFNRFIKLSMFSPHPEIPDACVIRKEVRSFLLEQQRGRHLWKRYHGKLAKFHKKRWQESQAPYYFREAVYHRFYEKAEEGMKMFDEHFWKFLDKFNFTEAEGLLEAVPLEILREKQRGKIDYAHARLFTSTAYSHQHLLSAEKLYDKIINTETDESLCCKYLISFGDLQEIMGRYNKEVECYQKALAIRLKAHGVEHPLVADVYNKIGAAYNVLGDYKKAHRYLEKALKIRKKVYGDEHSDVANSLHNIAFIRYKMGEYRKSLEYYQKSLLILLKVYGEEHPNIAISYDNTGIVYARLGEFDRALDYFRKSLGTLLKVYGEEHRLVADIYNNIGNIYAEQGNYEKAFEYFQKNLAVRTKVYGEEHPQIATYYNNIGTLYDRKCEYDKALNYYLKAIELYLQTLGEENPELVETYDNIGKTYYKHKKYNNSLLYFQKGLTMGRKIYGKEHFIIADLHMGIANTLWVLKKQAEALENIEKSVEIFRKFEFWKDAVEGLEILAGWLEEKGRTKEAEEARAEAQKIRKEHRLS